VRFSPAPHWGDALANIPATVGLARYADLPANIHGEVAPAGNHRLPVPVALDADDLAATDPARVAGHLCGVAVVSMAGHPAIGM
jgi:hypothetical protein